MILEKGEGNHWYGDSGMAIVFCRSCKTKITQRDTTCPKCGSPTSRLVPVVLCIALTAAALVLYTVARESLKDDDRSIAAIKSSAERSNSSETLRTVLSED